MLRALANPRPGGWQASRRGRRGEAATPSPSLSVNDHRRGKKRRRRRRKRERVGKREEAGWVWRRRRSGGRRGKKFFPPPAPPSPTKRGQEKSPPHSSFLPPPPPPWLLSPSLPTQVPKVDDEGGWVGGVGEETQTQHVVTEVEGTPPKTSWGEEGERGEGEHPIAVDGTKEERERKRETERAEKAKKVKERTPFTT